MEKLEFKDKRILVVDDEPFVREVIAEQLSFKGAVVVEAQDGKVAFDLLLDSDFDLVLSDIRMPECSGVELLKMIKESDKKMPPVLMMSAFEEVNTDRLKNLGAKEFLLKSGDFTQIEEAIKRLL